MLKNILSIMSIIILPLLRALLMGCFMVLPIEGLLKLNFYSLELTRGSFGLFLITVPVIIWIGYYIPFIYLTDKDERFALIRELSITLWPHAVAAIALTILTLLIKLTLTWVIVTILISLLVSIAVFVYEIHIFGQKISDLKGLPIKKGRINAALFFVVIPVILTLIIDAIL